MSVHFVILTCPSLHHDFLRFLRPGGARDAVAGQFSLRTLGSAMPLPGHAAFEAGGAALKN